MGTGMGYHNHSVLYSNYNRRLKQVREVNMEIDLAGKTIENKQILFKSYTNKSLKETDMELKPGNPIKLEAPKGSNAVLVKNLYLSCDPYMRGRMRDFLGSYIPPFSPGSAIEGFGVSKVVDSDDPNFKRGEFVAGITNWEEYTLIHKTGQLRTIQQDDGIPLSYHVLPSRNCRIDIYFDNVGGGTLDAALANMRTHGCVAVCGMVSQKPRTDLHSFRNMFSIISKRITIKGFLQSDFIHLYPRFLEDITYKQGKIIYIENMNHGLESAPAAFVGLFSGKNVGKQVICICLASE
ncbi:hypothetical protein L2E82_07394 [Cichorium intybus]|uniref:Uncharacterized protein n=1 Tax=Cichorium intybus TaxID=13427 RepID=A0ACB9G645_CICIN|nr:hypothetical protein L2E82_07394 [Cichorium intybus]